MSVRFNLSARSLLLGIATMALLAPQDAAAQQTSGAARAQPLDRVAPAKAAKIVNIDETTPRPTEDAPSIDDAILAAEVPVGKEVRLPTDPARGPAPEDEIPFDQGDDVRALDEIALHAREFATFPAPTPRAEIPIRDELDRFITTKGLHGPSLGLAAGIAAKHAEAAATRLNDPAYKDYWSELAVVVGMSGRAELAPRMTAAILSGDGTVSPIEANTRTDVVMALGYLAHTTKGEAGLDFLTECSAPAFWQARPRGWIAPWHRERSEQSAMMARTCLKGLALSGQKDAAKILRGLEPGSGDWGAYLPTADDLETWAGIADRIAEIGIIAYTD